LCDDNKACQGPSEALLLRFSIEIFSRVLFLKKCFRVIVLQSVFVLQQNIAIMSEEATRKAYTRSWGTKLKLGIKSDLNDDERIETIMEYLQDKAPQSCFDAGNRKVQTCHCLSCLDGEDDSNRNAVALYILWFSELEKQTQQLPSPYPRGVP
jgi:hypothetical protein